MYTHYINSSILYYIFIFFKFKACTFEVSRKKVTLSLITYLVKIIIQLLKAWSTDNVKKFCYLETSLKNGLIIVMNSITNMKIVIFQWSKTQAKELAITLGLASWHNQNNIVY